MKLSKIKIFTGGLFFCLLAALFFTFNLSPEQKIKAQENPQPPDYLYVVDFGPAMSINKKIMIGTLSGIVAQTKPEIYIRVKDNKASQIWLEDLKESYGITYDETHKDDLWWFVSHFKNHLNGYILHDTIQNDPEDPDKDGSVNVAVSLSGILKGIAIDPALEEQAKKSGLKKLVDVRGKDEEWLLEEWKKGTYEFNRDLVMRQKGNVAGQREISAFFKAFTFHKQGLDLLDPVLKMTNKNALLIGWWGGKGEDEYELISTASRNAVRTNIAFIHNLPIFTTLPKDNLKQPCKQTTVQTEDNVHYVAFWVGDSPNQLWQANNMPTSPKWWDNPLRGEFYITFGIGPEMSRLAPNIVQWLYKHATEKDCFAGSGTLGYIFPGHYPPDSLQKILAEENVILPTIDLKTLNFINDLNTGGITAAENYLKLSNVEGAIYRDYYKQGEEHILWYHNKPVVRHTYVLTDKEGHSVKDIAKAINNAPRKPKTEEKSYSIVRADLWSQSLDTTKELIDKLDPNVRVVSIETLIGLLKQNFGEKISLKRGWNQINWPDMSGYTTSSALTDINNDCGQGTGIAIARKKKDFWQEYVASFGGENFSLKESQEYSLKVSKDCHWAP